MIWIRITFGYVLQIDSENTMRPIHVEMNVSVVCNKKIISESTPPFRDANRIWRAHEMASGEYSKCFESKHISFTSNGVRFSLSRFVRLSTIGNHLREHSYAVAAIWRKSLSCFDWICGADRSDAAHNRHSMDLNMVLWYLSATFRTFSLSDITQGCLCVLLLTSVERIRQLHER